MRDEYILSRWVATKHLIQDCHYADTIKMRVVFVKRKVIQLIIEK